MKDEIEWSTVHRTTRTQATVTSFGWRIKTVLCLPPIVILGFWMYKFGSNYHAAAVGIGGPMMFAAIWWCKQVWKSSGRPTVEQPTHNHATSKTTTAKLETRPRIHPNFTYLYDQAAKTTDTNEL